ncbi:MAG: hypothetical protein FJZ01_21280 [Candidatus Sericytochromatia bacterium]|nr:hypothetical protein [Candidatus Tanganyikabacteria bacterium]
MHRSPLLPASVVSVLAFAGCLQGPALQKPTPTPKPTGTPRPAPTPVATPATCTPVPTLPPPTGTLTPKTTVAWVAVEFAAGNDVVATLRNLSSQSVDVTGWQLCGGEFVYGTLSKTRTALPANKDVKIHVNTVASCAESETEWCAEVGTGVTALAGNLAIYKTPVSFGAASSIVDFVEWGGGGKPREDVAVKAGIWTAGVGVPVNGCQASLSVKVPGASGAQNWQ